MIGTSFAEWVFIRLSITFCRFAPVLESVPLLWLYLSRGKAASDMLTTKILGGLLVAEGVFYFGLYWPHVRSLDREARHPTPLSTEERSALMKRVLVNVSSPERYLQWWFLGSPVQDIRRDNLREFLLWAFYDWDEKRHGPAGDQEGVEEELRGFIAAVETRLGRSLGDGRGPAESFRLTFDPVRTTYKSILWYGIVFFIDGATHLAMLWHGYQYFARPTAASWTTFPPRPQELLARKRSPTPNLSYWYRPHKAEDAVPAVFLHGIGIGLWTYTRFLGQLGNISRQNQGQLGVIAVELLPISFRFTSQPLGKAEFLDEITSILNQHGWDDFTLTTHSYGSVLATHMLRSSSISRNIRSLVLIDPVTIMLHMPDVAFNFTRRHPRHANEWQLWYFASTDPDVAYCLGRHFFWQQNILWKSDIARWRDANHLGTPAARKRACVCLAGRDLIVDTATVMEYLKGPHGDGDPSDAVDQGVNNPAEVIFFPQLDHAQVFDSPSDAQQVLSLVESYCSI